MKKVLITSKSFGSVDKKASEILEQAGCEIVFYNDRFDEAEFVERLKDCEGLIIGAHKLSEEAVKAADKLKIVCKHGAGLDNIDMEVMGRYGVKVTNVPAVNADSVADLTFGLLLDVARKITYSASNVKSGKWKYAVGTEVYDKTLALIGFGNIAQRVAKRASGFSMKVLTYDPFISEIPDEFKHFVSLVTFEEALAKADFLSIHVPLSEATKDLITTSEMKKMKKSAFIINTSRGGIVNEVDLADALTKGIIAGAGLDVTEKEPIDVDNALLKFDEVVITPHMGMYSVEAISKVSVIAAENIVKYI